MQYDNSGAAMDRDVSREIKEAWSQGKDASGAAAFQENGEIALSEGNDNWRRHFSRMHSKIFAKLGASQNTILV